MPETKKTGLGSMLFRRTTPAEQPPEAPRREAPRYEPVEQSAPTPPPAGTRPRQEPKPIRDRCTLYLDPDVNVQLDVTSRVEGRQRSEVVTELLRKYLPRYRIQRQ